MTDKNRWVNLGCRDGLYCLVSNGAHLVRLATPDDADDVVAILNSLERDAAFGRQCIQDSCEGAWITASVHQKVCAELQEAKRLLNALGEPQ